MQTTSDIVQHMVSLYEVGIKEGKTGLEMGLNFDFRREGFYYENEDGERIWLSENQMADMPNGVGDEKTAEIKAWAQSRH